MLAYAESNFSNFKFEYLCENEFKKTVVAWYQIRDPDGIDS